MEKISITRALAELKLLDSRIQKTISSGVFVTELQRGKKINSRLTVDEFDNIVFDTIKSVNDLIARRDKIKKAIVMSNAYTRVNIGDVEMTVAEAIEKKTSIQYDQMFLDTMHLQLKRAELGASQGNIEADKKALDALQSALGKDAVKTSKEEDIKAIYNPIYDRYKYDIIDPAKVAVMVEKLRNSIDEFKMNVDFELSTSNATTLIEI